MKPKPVIIVEPTALEAASATAVGYDVIARPTPDFDATIYIERRVILWPDATPESREAYRELANKINAWAHEVKIIAPNGQPAGWNIAAAIKDGWTWEQLTSWAKVHAIPYPKISVETTEAAVPLPESITDLTAELGLAATKAGTVICNADNVLRILERWEPFKNFIWYDEFYRRYFMPVRGGKREWADIDDVKFLVVLQRDFGMMKLTKEHVVAGIQLRGAQCTRNEPKDWMRALPWDGTSRLDRFFIDYFGAAEMPYTFAISKNFWIALIARIFAPGCQVDNMVILEGPQGIFKSKALEIIGGPWYMEASAAVDNKDFLEGIQGKLLVEIAELDSFSKADSRRVKRIITCRTDRFRKPYGRLTNDYPRQSIFVGTTNEKHYLVDDTGARRFWPIRCGRIDLGRLKQDREQLFAEAVSRYLNNETWWELPEEQTKHEQENRRQFDEWENIVSTYVRQSCLTQITLADIASQVGLDKSQLDIPIQRRLGAILRRLGWESQTVRHGDQIQRVWLPVPGTPTHQPLLSAENAALSGTV